jgi:hypothetical protein
VKWVGVSLNSARFLSNRWGPPQSGRPEAPKPVDPAVEIAVDPILSAIMSARNRDELPDEVATVRVRLRSLPPALRQVMAEAFTGSPNKIIAYRLGRRLRTIENQRYDLMHRLGVHTFVAVVEMVFILRVADAVFDYRSDPAVERQYELIALL